MANEEIGETSNMRQEYGNDSVDELFCFFMKTVLRIKKKGVLGIHIDISINEIIDGYLAIAIPFLTNGIGPDLSDLLLQTEYDYLLLNKQVNKNDILLLNLIRRFIKQMQLGELEIGGGIVNIWNNKAFEYAQKTFYCNFPLDIQKKHGWNQELNMLLKLPRFNPATFFEPDNF